MTKSFYCNSFSSWFWEEYRVPDASNGRGKKFLTARLENSTPPGPLNNERPLRTLLGLFNWVVVKFSKWSRFLGPEIMHFYDISFIVTLWYSYAWKYFINSFISSVYNEDISWTIHLWCWLKFALIIISQALSFYYKMCETCERSSLYCNYFFY